MKSLYYKPIKRRYYDVDSNLWKDGIFIARGEFTDGHLAYSMLDDQGEEIEGEETSWYQVVLMGRLVMLRI